MIPPEQIKVQSPGLGGKPYLRVLHDAGYIRLYAVGDAEVDQLQRGVHDDKVGGLQVTVDDPCTEERRDTAKMTHVKTLT